MRWRNIGPANHQGRVTDVQGIPWPSRTFYVASAGGGVWKSTNAGTTFRPVFENEHVSSGGMLAIAPSDTNVVYYGTGEPNTRNSISPGAGVYKTVNGGKTLGVHRPQGDGADRPHRREPARREHRVRRRAGPRVGLQQGAWPLQEHRRRKNVGAEEVHQRQSGIRRRGARPARPEHRVGVELRARAQPLLVSVRRAGIRALEEHRRRRDVDRGQGRRISRDDERTHRHRDRRVGSERHVRAGRGGHRAESRRRTRRSSRRNRRPDCIAPRTPARRGTK